MSRTPSEINDNILKYIRNVFAQEDEFLLHLVEESKSFGFPQISIAPEQAVFLQFLIKSTGVCNILEIGSLFGYSSICMARALPEGGTITAVEMNSAYAGFIRKKVELAGLSEKVKVVHSNAVKFLESYKPEKPLDMVFLDADKTNYKYYLDKITPLLKKGGIVAADNALAFGYIAEEEIEESQKIDVLAIRKFNTYLANHPSYLSSIVTLGDGIALGVKL